MLELTKAAQFQQITPADAALNHQLRLEGTVLWADAAAGKFVLQDGTAAVLLEMDLHGQPLPAGERVRITGNGPVVRAGGGYRLGVHGAVVDDDGVHGMQEKSGSIWLPAGFHPLCLDWFNATAESGLAVEFSGPGLPRQKIPDHMLYRAPTNAPPASLPEHGLDFASYDVSGEVLPDFKLLPALTNGAVNNFDISVRSHPEHVGLSFSGLLEVPHDGLYTFYLRSDDGSRLFIDAPSLQLEKLGQAALRSARHLALGQVMDDECEWAQVAGTVVLAWETAGGLGLELRSGTGTLQVELVGGAGRQAAEWTGRQVRATGVCVGTHSTDGQIIAGTLLVADAKQIERVEPWPDLAAGSSNSLPILTSAAEVHRLKREEAQRSYPVAVRGVVTCVLPDHQGFTLQDASRGLYAVDLSTNRSHLPEIGSFVTIQGTTDPGLFAPVVNATMVMDLGAGHLPDPVRPTWDQLQNGSLDAQYVEVQGIITVVNTNGVTLLMNEGRVNVELRVPGMPTPALLPFENALVRVRGCLFANWDYVTHEVKAGEVRIYGATIAVDQPAPADLFATQQKTFGQLLLFDPQAGAFQRIKVAGQILAAQDATFYMTDGKSGLRFVVTKPIELAPSDLAEVVGFPDLSGASPLLREAVARKTGHAPLPPARLLPKDDLMHTWYDATRVQVRGTLVSVRDNPVETVLEIQNGLRTFVARLARAGSLAASLPTGCQLELTGVYCGLGGNKAVGQDITSFELLLNRPGDIRVLARPPWWTLERLLVIVGALACVLAVTVLWITQLHRTVEVRTVELGRQIQERQRIEQQRAMEQERARVAQDLHDELGSSLTEISMLAVRARAAAVTEERRGGYLEQIGGRARDIVTVLDEIVWAMNPRHDSMSSLVSYFCLYADRFLGLAGIAWQLETTDMAGDFAVDSRCRHQLFLAFKEALTNVVRHAQATEVTLRFGLAAGEVLLSIADNGRGFPAGERTETMDGVANMRARVEKLGGRFELTSPPDGGTTLRFQVPAGKNL